MTKNKYRDLVDKQVEHLTVLTTTLEQKNKETNQLRLRVQKLEQDLQRERDNLARTIAALIHANTFIKQEQEALLIYRTEALRNLAMREEKSRNGNVNTELFVAE